MKITAGPDSCPWQLMPVIFSLSFLSYETIFLFALSEAFTHSKVLFHTLFAVDGKAQAQT